MLRRNKGKISLLTLVFVLISVLLPPNNASAGFMDYVNFACVTPEIYPKACVRFSKGRLQVGVKVKFWLPIGIIEVTPKACDFLGLGLLKDLNPLTSICNSIPLAQGEATQNWSFSQNYMRSHVHIFVIPKPILDAIATAIKAKFRLPCVSFDMSGVLSLSSGALGSSLEKLKDVQQRLDAINQLLQGFSPVFISELVSPIWLNDLLSPDTKTVAPAINAAMSTLTQASPVAGVLACPHMTKHLGKYLSNPLIDPSFICVGHWGYGYPRIGVVRHDDPKIALALAGVRFWHLFSKTIPVISEKFSYDHRLQVAYPAISPCFKPGDPVLPQLSMTYLPDRKIALIIWKNFGCCNY